MSQAELEQALKDLPRTGTLVKGRAYREVWRFEVGGRGHYLKFYPRRGKRLKRLLRGDPAMREFARLQWLQKASVPAPRAVAVLKGFQIDGRAGDAVILEAIEPAVPLDQVLNQAELTGERVPGRYGIAAQVMGIVRSLAKAGLGHTDMHLGNFLLKGDGTVYLLDAYAVRRGGVTLNQLLLLGHSVGRYATRTEMVRGWWELAPDDARMPARNPVSVRLWHKMAGRAVEENAYFAKLRVGEWTGFGFKRAKFPYAWSRVSGMTFDRADLERAWGELSGRIERGEVQYLKQSESGDVMAADVEVGGKTLSVVMKEPRRKQWHRWFTDVLRGDRAMRAWVRAWELIARDIPTAWPIMVMRRTVAGYPVESAIVFERVEGVPLAHVKLGEMSEGERDTLFRRVGRLLRRIDESGYYHRDAKSDNVMVERGGNVPVLVDLDGIRELTFGRWSLPRMLASMKLHKAYAPADSMSLCKGYAPYARVAAERDGEGGTAS